MPLPNPRHRRRLLLWLPTALVLALLGAVLAPAAADPPLRSAAGNRITLVFAGDGFTRAQLPRYRAEVRHLWRAFTAVEPYRTYRNFFRERRLDVVSPTSGVSGDPHRGTGHPTPLGMHYWCRGLERLLCADEGRISAETGGNSARRHVVAVADSRLYGGAGGNRSTTVSGGNRHSGGVFQHEIGHTLGGLGDEYDGAYRDFPGTLSYPNLSRSAARPPWRRWLGASDPSGGRVGAYRGSDGLYRPTRNSMMRTLGDPYNLPSREALVKAFYRAVSPLDGASPRPGAHVARRGVLAVRPMRLTGGRQLRVRWSVDGHPVRRENGRRTFPASRAGRGRHRITATVVDTTPWVRDAAFRKKRMTRSVSWTVG